LFQSDKDHPGWPAGFPGYPPQMMAAFRMQFPPGYEPPRGPGPHNYPYPMFYMPYGLHPNMQQAPHQQKNNENKEEQPSDQKGADSANFAPLKEDNAELSRKAAAQLKLKKLEEKMKERTKQDDIKVEDLDHDHKNKEETDYSVRPLPRSRNDSEASDSSRRSGKEIPPRFQRKKSGQSELNVEESKDNPYLYHMYVKKVSTGKHFVV